jgi:hypothetical protein
MVRQGYGVQDTFGEEIILLGQGVERGVPVECNGACT